MSEKSRIHSLNPYDKSLSLSCCSIATPIHSGNEEFPSNMVSHRWNNLCSGNTSVKYRYGTVDFFLSGHSNLQRKLAVKRVAVKEGFYCRQNACIKELKVENV